MTNTAKQPKGTRVPKARKISKKVASHTKQEWFDLAVRGLAKQGWEKSSLNGECVYGRPGGRRCAVGHGLGDFVPKEGALANDLVADGLAVVSDEEVRDSEFLDDLQVTHDMSDDRKAQYLRKDIRDFGIRWGLKWPSDVPRTGTIGKPRIRGVKATLVAVDEAEVSQ